MKKLFQSRNDDAPAGPARRPSKMAPVNSEEANIKYMTDEDKVRAVMAKLKTANKQASSMTEEMLKVFAMSLALEEQIKNKYLNPELANTIAVVRTSKNKSNQQKNQQNQ